MRTALIIPARLQAIRLPGKPLAELGGLPLVVRVAQQALKVPNAQIVAVATDSPVVAKAVRAHGIEVAMTQSTHISGTQRVAEAAASLDADCVINVQGDEPFIDPADLADLVAAIATGKHDMVTLKRPIASEAEFDSPNVVKVVCRDDGQAMYFSRAPIPHDRYCRYGTPGCFAHVGVYGFRRQALMALCDAPPHALEEREGLEQLKALAMGLSIAVLNARTASRGIDTQDDLAWAQAHVAHLGEAAFPNLIKAVHDNP